jgi:20S proteasome alpha/beta subunit
VHRGLSRVSQSRQILSIRLDHRNTPPTSVFNFAFELRPRQADYFIVKKRRGLTMDYLMGLKGKDFVMLCSDTTAVQQIITIKHDEDKIVPIDSHKVMALAGEPGDRVQFSEYIIANVKLYALRNDAHLSTHAVANFTRGELATALRKVLVPQSVPPLPCVTDCISEFVFAALC